MTRAELAAKLMAMQTAEDSEASGGKTPLQKFIAEAAYYKAEKRGFKPGFEQQDWVEAEAEIQAAFGRQQRIPARSNNAMHP